MGLKKLHMLDNLMVKGCGAAIFESGYRETMYNVLTTETLNRNGGNSMKESIQMYFDNIDNSVKIWE